METEEDIRSTMHSYAKPLDSQLEMDILMEQEDSCLAQLLPETRKPQRAKKSKTFASSENETQPVSNSLLLTVMERIEKMQEESLRRLHSLKTSVKDNTSSIKSVTDALVLMGKQVEDMRNKVETLQVKLKFWRKKTLCSMTDATTCTLTKGGGIYELLGSLN